jgi:hypothetical protein
MSKQHAKFTGAGAIEAQIQSTLGIDYNVYEVRLHLSTGADATGAEPVTLSLLSSGSTSSPFNCVIESTAITGAQNYYYRPTIPLHFKHNDKFRVAWANDASSYKTYGLEIVWDYF